MVVAWCCEQDRKKVVVASDKEHKRRDTVHDTFNTYASLSSQHQVVTLLKTVATNIEEGQP